MKLVYCFVTVRPFVKYVIKIDSGSLFFIYRLYKVKLSIKNTYTSTVKSISENDVYSYSKFSLIPVITYEILRDLCLNVLSEFYIRQDSTVEDT